MRVEWPLSGRDAEVRRFSHLLSSREVRGVVLAGPPGVGKTFFANHCLRIAARAGFSTAEVIATKSAAAMPFGALAHLLPAGEHGTSGMADRHADLIRRLAAGLAERAGTKGLVLFVDDAHILDSASAALVHHLVTNDIAFVLATVRSSTPAPDAITALWKDRDTERIELRGLGTEAVESLLPQVLGGSVDPAAVAHLAARSQGNMLFLRELVFGALDTGMLREERGIWRLAGPLAPSERLSELVQIRLESLQPQDRSMLEVLAHGEPLGPAEISSFAAMDVLERLERLRLIRTSQDGRRLEFRLAHPLYGDVLRAATPVFRARSIAHSLADAVERTGARRREDALRIATWRLDAGSGTPELLLAAAKRSRWHYDFPLAERLARAAAETAGQFEAALLAAEMASLQGRGPDAEIEFAKLAELAEDDTQRMMVATLRVDNLAIYQGQLEEGLRVAEAAESVILDPAARDEVRAKRSTIVLGLEGPRAAAELVEPLVDRAHGGALVWSCAIGAHSLGRTGQIDRALAFTEKGHAAHLALREPFEWYPWIHLFFRCEAKTYAGRLEEAESLAHEQHQRALVDQSEEAQAWFAWQLSKVALARGCMATAAEHGREAVALFASLGRRTFEQAASASLAIALSALGKPAEAVDALKTSDLLGLPIWYPIDILEARAWTAVAQGKLADAHQFLFTARDLARTAGDRVGEAAVLSALARLGHADQVRLRLDELAQHVEGTLVANLAEHAALIARRDPDGLEALSQTFAAMGAGLLAAECAAEAARAWRHDGRERKALLAEQQAGALARQCGRVMTPALSVVTSRARLTPTEMQVALLAQGGSSNREIADELFLSIRTVGNHLHRAYQKLGVAGREELRLNVAQDATAQP